MIRTIIKDLPSGVKGFTLADKDGDYTIFLNARQTREMNKQTYRHELQHIYNHDFRRNETAGAIETARHDK